MRLFRPGWKGSWGPRSLLVTGHEGRWRRSGEKVWIQRLSGEPCWKETNRSRVVTSLKLPIRQRNRERRTELRELSRIKRTSYWVPPCPGQRRPSPPQRSSRYEVWQRSCYRCLRSDGSNGPILPESLPSGLLLACCLCVSWTLKNIPLMSKKIHSPWPLHVHNLFHTSDLRTVKTGSLWNLNPLKHIKAKVWWKKKNQLCSFV